MKSGWFIVVVMGVLASVARLGGPAPLADIAAVAYLLTVTVIFDRARRNAQVRTHAARPEQSLQA